MRTIISLIFVVLFAIITLPVLLVMWIMSKFSPRASERLCHACMSFLLRGLKVLSGVNLTVNGMENIPDDKGVLFIGNHRSYFDIIFTYPLNKKPTSYVAKSDLKKIPLFSQWGQMMQVLFFDRSDIRASVQMIKDGAEILKSGNNVFIYPEGGRNKNESQLDLLPFHDGSFKMASKANAPVIPVAIKNCADVWEAHFPWLKRASVTITYGKPFYISDLDAETRKHIGEHVQGIMKEMLINS